MFKKVINDDGELESLNDKRASSILLLNGLMTILETFRSKIFTLQDIECLEEMVTFMRHINMIVNRVVGDCCSISQFVYTPTDFYPLIRQARQMEIFTRICGTLNLLGKLKKNYFFKECNKVYLLNNFLRSLKPSLAFLEQFLLRTSHFHVIVPPLVPAKRQKCTEKYT